MKRPGKRQCQKGKPCGATCIERKDECLKDAGYNVSQSLGLVRDYVRSPKVFKIAKSADTKTRPAQLEAKRALNNLSKEQSLIKTNGLVEQNRIKWDYILGSGVKMIGNGAFGSFTTIPTSKLVIGQLPNNFPKEVGVKAGKIGPNEVRAIDLTGKINLGPRLVSAKVSPKIKKVYGLSASDGIVAMTKVPGTKYDNAPDNVKGVTKSNLAWQAMAKLHKLGIAHNDLHGDNIIIDSTGKFPRARIVDFGLAQISYKAALAEALGVFSGKNDRFAGSKREGYAEIIFKNSYKVFLYLSQNIKFRNFVDDRNKVMDGGIWKTDKSYQRGAWGKITEEQAKEMINILYEGVD